MILSDETLALLANLGDGVASDALSWRRAGSYAFTRGGQIFLRM